MIVIVLVVFLNISFLPVFWIVVCRPFLNGRFYFFIILSVYLLSLGSSPRSLSFEVCLHLVLGVSWWFGSSVPR